MHDVLYNNVSRPVIELGVLYNNVSHPVIELGVLYNNVSQPVMCEVGIVLTCGKYFQRQHYIIKREVSAHKTSLTPPLFIEMSVRNHSK